MMTNWWTYASNISNILDILKSHAWWISYHQPPPPALLGEESCCGSEERQPHLRKTPPKWGQNPFLKSYDMIKPGDVTPLAMVTFKYIYICIHILIYYIYIHLLPTKVQEKKKDDFQFSVGSPASAWWREKPPCWPWFMPKREKRPELWSGYLSIYGYLHTSSGYKYEIWIDMEWIDMEWI